MREILFRGKRVKDNTWVYGFLFITRKSKYNIKWYDPHFGSSNTSEVYPESVGQFTGLTSGGVKLFEGDIIKGKVNVIGGYRVRTGEIKYYIDGFKMKVGSEYKNIPFECELIGAAFDNLEE